MKLTIVGSGDAFGSGGRFNTCLHLSTESGQSMLVDCGASSMTALTQGGHALNDIEAILFTHFHGDHFGGLPFFVLASQFVTRRSAPLRIFGPTGIADRARAAMEAAFPGSWDAKRQFEIAFDEIAPGPGVRIGEVDVIAYPMVHDERAGPCLGYRMSADAKSVSFTGDTAWCEALPALAEGADVLIAECYTYDRQLPNHLDWRTLESRLSALDAGKIIVTHMGPQMLAWHGQLPVERAADGLVALQ